MIMCVDSRRRRMIELETKLRAMMKTKEWKKYRKQQNKIDKRHEKDMEAIEISINRGYYKMLFNIKIKIMIIHGKKLEQINDGEQIYYDNIKITDKKNGLNYNMTFSDWKNLIEKDQSFNPVKYNPCLFKNPENTKFKGLSFQQDVITLRDYFAGLAMQGIISKDKYYPLRAISLDSYDMADEMLRVREENKV